MEIFRPEDVPAEEPKDMPGVKVRWVIDQKRGAETFSMRIFEVAPGAATPLHEHWYEQEMYLIEGHGAMVSDHGERPLDPGLVVWVPPHERHQVRNTGTVPLKFICCIPQQKR